MRALTAHAPNRREAVAANAWLGALLALAVPTAALELPHPTPLSPAAYLVTVTNPGPGVGTIASDPAGLSCDTSCSGWFPAGSALTFNATAAAGNEFMRWFGDCEGTAPCALTIDGPKTVVGHFTPAGEPYTILRHFMPGAHDGAGPYYTHLVSDGTFLYGMTLYGGRSDYGVVFRMRPDGTDRELLHEFVGGVDDGRSPYGSLTLVGSVLYGMTAYGGENDAGVVFRLQTDGTGFAVLRSFGGSSDDGRTPHGSLIVYEGDLYGMTRFGGSFGVGTVFRLGTDGSGYQILRSFDWYSGDGYYPTGALTPLGGYLYGTAPYYAFGTGVVFRLRPDGTDYQVVYAFDFENNPERPCDSLIADGGFLYGMTNHFSQASGSVFRLAADGTDFQVLVWLHSDSGSEPYGSLIVKDGALFGVTSAGGTYSAGTVFRVGTDGTGFSVLHAFRENPEDGRDAYGSLLALGDQLYGLTHSGGSGLRGTVFRLGQDGTSYQIVHSFSPPGPDCGQSFGELVAQGQSVFGSAYQGGSAGLGAVFRVNADGTDYQILHSFAGGAEDGARPYAGLAVADGVLYGTTLQGGSADQGTVFRVNTDGSSFQVLHSFGTFAKDGRRPYGSVVHSDGVLYGVAAEGGPHDFGMLYRINTDGSGYQLVADPYRGGGKRPLGTLLLHDGWLYGTAAGGAWYGSVFRVRTDGSGYTVLHYFGSSAQDGQNPYGSLTMAGETLFGTTLLGGSRDRGALFSLRPDGSEYKVLHEFLGAPGDGANPQGSLLAREGALYGQSFFGGAFGHGCLFRVNQDGSAYKVLHSFPSAPRDGGGPYATPLLVGDLLLGLTAEGGAGNGGTLYTLRKDLTIAGTITTGGLPLPAVTMLGLPGEPRTDANGHYSARVPQRWTGQVIPVLSGYSFSPASRSFSDVQADRLDEDFESSTCASLSLLPEELPSGWLGDGYNVQLAVTGGSSPFTFALGSGTLPAGIVLNGETGVMSGTPASAGGFTFAIVASDAAGCSTFRTYTIAVSSHLSPVSLRVDEFPGGSMNSDLNGVLEKGEGVTVSPSWHNGSDVPRVIASTASNAAGPAEGKYGVSASTVSYGTIPPGTTVDAATATGDAFFYFVRLDPFSTRPAPHWDARFTETLSDGTTKTWTVHIGDSFADVPRSHWAYRFIETIFHNEVTAGCGGEPLGFCPEATLTRAEAAVLLLMAKHGSGYVPPPATGLVFGDVPADHWAGDFIEQLAAEGISSGCAPAMYCPTSPITRAEMAVFLLMAEHGLGYVPPASTGLVFGDVPIDHWAGDFIEQLVAEGITSGCAPSLYCPEGIVTRAEMAVFLSATFGLELNQ